MSTRAFITPEVLRWARETAHYSVEEIANKIKVKSIKVEAWEEGRSQPTIRQLRILSGYFRRPLSVFFLPKPPADFSTIRDFRRQDLQAEFSPALALIIRELQEKQAWVKEMLSEDGAESLGFIGKFNLKSIISDVAKDIIRTLGITDTTRIGDSLKNWITSCEKSGIFISRTSHIHTRLLIDPEEVRGFALCDSHAPFIFINSGDYSNPQLFTLIHELAHLWISESGVSSYDIVDFRSKNSRVLYDPVERFCNRVAAEVLIPEIELKTAIKQVKTRELLAVINSLSKVFAVSTMAVSVRLRELNIIGSDDFQKAKEHITKSFEEYLSRKKEDKPKELPIYYPLRMNRNGYAFTAIVYTAYKSGRILSSEVNDLLGVKVSNLPKLDKYIFGRQYAR